MAASAGVSAFNTKIWVYKSAAWALVEEPKDITGPGSTAEFIDFTHQQSPSGFRERKPSFKSGGDVTFTCNFVHSATVQQYLVNCSIANPPSREYFKVVGPDNSQFEFGAYVSFTMSYPLNGPEEIRFTLGIDGNVVAALASVSVSASASAS
jgi:hypothetical protein